MFRIVEQGKILIVGVYTVIRLEIRSSQATLALNLTVEKIRTGNSNIRNRLRRIGPDKGGHWEVVN